MQLKYYFLPQMKHLIQQSALKSKKLKMILASLPLLFPNFSKIGGGFWRIGFGFFFFPLLLRVPVPVQRSNIVNILQITVRLVYTDARQNFTTCKYLSHTIHKNS